MPRLPIRLIPVRGSNRLGNSLRVAKRAERAQVRKGAASSAPTAIRRSAGLQGTPHTSHKPRSVRYPQHNASQRLPASSERCVPTVGRSKGRRYEKQGHLTSNVVKRRNFVAEENVSTT